MMPASASQPKHKHVIRNSILIVIAMFAAACGAFLGYKAVQNHDLQYSVEGSFHELQAILDRDDVHNMRFTNQCSRFEVGFGQGDKHCSISIQYVTEDSTSFTRAASALASALNDSRDFIIDKGNVTVPTFADGEDADEDFGFRHRATNFDCTLLYAYVQNRAVYKASFSCTNTSWFTKTFNF